MPAPLMFTTGLLLNPAARTTAHVQQDLEQPR
jgi:hypothetical protein